MKISSEAAMQKLGQTIGRSLKGGEAIELVGDVGAGKTTLTKGIALGLGIKEVISSPTFTISQIYQNKKGPNLYHYDFYRLHEPGLMKYELAGALYDETAVTILEWADSVQDILPDDHIVITLQALSEADRKVDIQGIVV